MLKTNTQIKKLVFIAIFAVFMVPVVASAGGDNNYGGYSLGGWNYGSGSYSQPVSYTSYSYTPTYSSGVSSYRPSYSSGYSYPSYSSYGYTYPSYSSSYVPSYGGYYSSGGSYATPSYSNTSVKNNNKVTSTNTNTNTSTATASASSTNINNNINNNNVYVYTNPGGNAVVYNPSHVNLSGYCTVVPTNPRVGQTVTATAYASGGVGDYTYVWSGDINYTTGSATSFTSYTPGTKNITVTIRSGQETVTRTCEVTFYANTYVNNYYGSSYSSYVPTGTPVSGVFTQRLTSGTPVSGVYLNDLPATGLSLNFIHYMIIAMTLILAAVATFVYQARKRLISENI